tara:strand:+ start:6911 stop:7195 length:285 start_codon:yes stop_codon:yes gene_type:complete
MIRKETIIYQLYPQVVVIYTNGSSFDAKDKDGKSVSIDQNAIDAEFVKQDYQNKREVKYPTLKEQLDMQYWDQVNGTNTWKDAIAKVKTDNPKP